MKLHGGKQWSQRTERYFEVFRLRPRRLRPDSDLKPRAVRAAPKGSKQSEERYPATSLGREECPKRKHRAGERGRRGALRQASRLWRHCCSSGPRAALSRKETAAYDETALERRRIFIGALRKASLSYASSAASAGGAPSKANGCRNCLRHSRLRSTSLRAASAQTSAHRSRIIVI